MIDKEDNILYQKVEQVLTPSDQQELLSEFEEVASEPGKCDKLYDVTL